MEAFRHLLTETDGALRRGDLVDWWQALGIIERNIGALSHDPDPIARLERSFGALQELRAHQARSGRDQLASDVAAKVAEIEGELRSLQGSAREELGRRGVRQ